MGINGALRHPREPAATVVAFDFDGTLTDRDSFIGFLVWKVGAAGFAAGLLRAAPAICAYGFNRDRGALKAAIAGRFLGGATRGDIAQDARRFAETRFKSLIRPDALRCWEEWGAKGASRIIVTASPEILVSPFARLLGAEGVIGTRLAFDREDRFTGALEGKNCRGPEKVARLRAALGPDVDLAAAYGDTAGDREMLAMAGIAGLRVFQERP
jgi:phosphatidylglycerophosphatase C